MATERAEETRRLPPTAYLWLALLLLTYLIPPLLPGKASLREKAAATGGGLSSSEFQRIVTIEARLRAAFALSENSPALLADPARLRAENLKLAAADLQTLLRAPSSTQLTARRLIVVEAARGLPIDSALAGLRGKLQTAETPSAQIRDEVQLWHDLYKTRSIAASRASSYAQRIQDMRLGFLTDQALADLYKAADDMAAATRSENRLRAEALRYTTRSGLLNIGVVVVFLAGLVFLGLFLYAARTRKWERIQRVSTQPQRLAPPLLADVFLFYLALYRAVSLLIGATLSRMLPPELLVLAAAAVTFGVGVAAIGYLAWRAHGVRVPIADIGLSTRGQLVANIGYGIAGYAATLPLILLAAWLSRLLLGENSSTAPNPILPLLAGERSQSLRLVIFALVSFAAPLFEEIFFRGVLYSALRHRFAWSVAAAVSAGLFALMHPMSDWLAVATLGFSFAVLREMRQSLVPGMVAHFLQNTFTFLSLSLLFPPGG